MIAPALARCDEHVGDPFPRSGCRDCLTEQREAAAEAVRAAEAARAEFFENGNAADAAERSAA